MTYFSTEEICMIEMLTYYNDSIMNAVEMPASKRMDFNSSTVNLTVKEILSPFLEENNGKRYVDILEEIDDIVDTAFIISGKEWAKVIKYILSNDAICDLKLADVFEKDGYTLGQHRTVAKIKEI